MLCRRWMLAGLLLIPAALPAQGAAPRFGCTDPEYRQFDFWVGKWDVTVQGRPVGTNEVTLEEGGCLIHEHWTGARGGTGQSFNYLDRAGGQWHQQWVDNSGHSLTLAGGYGDRQMRFTGVTAGADGAPVQQRLTFFANADGTVRQLWESSTDGKQWKVVFDGLYRRHGS
jgi:hypothetical protein